MKWIAPPERDKANNAPERSSWGTGGVRGGSALSSPLSRMHAPARRLAPDILSAIRPFYFRAFIGIVRRGERIFSPRVLLPFLFPLLVPDILRRLGDYAHFKRLRDSLPAGFWRTHPFIHYVRMILLWNQTLASAVLYDRLRSPPWSKRMKVSGTPPEKLAGWGRRPVVLAFLHTGGFVLLRYWLRARGVRTASWVRAVPGVLSSYSRPVREAGDALYGFPGVPHTFVGVKSLRQALRFLQPGSVLAIALDGGREAEGDVVCDAGGHPFHLRDGAVRLAASANAILLSVSVHHMGNHGFEFRFGKPVPDHLVRAGDTGAAMQHLARELWRNLQNDPAAIGWTTLAALAPEKALSWTAWP